MHNNIGFSTAHQKGALVDTCPKCKGKKTVPGLVYGSRKCPTCRGIGYIDPNSAVSRQTDSGFFDTTPLAGEPLSADKFFGGQTQATPAAECKVEVTTGNDSGDSGDCSTSDGGGDGGGGGGGGD